MKQLYLSIALLIILISPKEATCRNNPRITVNLNREWEYRQGDTDNAEKEHTGWERTGLPHSFSIPYFMSKDFYVGYGWYRKHLSFTKTDLSKSVFLEFDGVFQEAEVFVNGRQAGKHTGGYTGFSIYISPFIRQGDNMITVRVNNIWKPDVAPRGGEHVFSGGIYRNVRLVMKGPTYIDWNGTFVTAEGLKQSEGRSGSVKIQTSVCNMSESRGTYRLLTLIKDGKGKCVASTETEFEIDGKGTKTIEQNTKAIADPELWHPEHPALYKAESRLYKESKLIDKEYTTFGFRWIEWTADKGFFINGKRLFFKGANVHQDQAGWGDAVTEAAARRDVRMMKDAGFDFIRGSHYPHSPAFSDACDTEGMLFWPEAPFWGTAGPKDDGYWTASAYPIADKDYESFEQNALQQLEEMIRIHRNHPSIITWSMCNEPFFSTPEAMTGVRRLLGKMTGLIHKLDPTRPAAAGGVQRPLGNNRIDMIGDIAGYNGDGSTIADFQNPGIANVVTEYGSTTADRPGKYMPGWGDLNRNDGWKGRMWRCGQAIWCGFDHGSIFGNELGKMGIVDYFRIPKRSWYWYRNEYRHIAPPEWAKEGEAKAIRLTASKQNGILADGTDDALLTVTMLGADGHEVTASPEVTLKIVSGPGEFPTGTAITFKKESDIRILDGKAAIAIRSYYSGTATVVATAKGMKPARIKLSFCGAPRFNKRTNAVKERPYIRFVREKADSIMTLGCNNPTFASSSASGHPAGYAADGDSSTWWQPEATDNEALWTVDTERSTVIQDITIEFARPRPCSIAIETSADNINWKLYACSDKPGNTTREFFSNADKPRARFIRIRLKNIQPTNMPGISETAVRGKI